MKRTSHLRAAMACAAIAAAALPVRVDAQSRVVRTDDGFTLTFTEQGWVGAVQLDRRELSLADTGALFHLRDAAATNPAFVAPRGTAGESANGIALHLGASALGLELRATVSARGGFLEIDGEVQAREPAERCIDLKISLPVDLRGFVADAGLYDGPAPPLRRSAKKKSAVSDPEVDAAGSDDNALYPLSPISSRATGAGLTVAVPPTHPTRFTTGSDATGVHVTLRIGLSPATAKPNTTRFRVIVYGHDAAWGFRAALARYYEFYREDFFTRRVKRMGAWTTQRPSKLANPQLYAYYEAGFATWRHPEGTDSGVNVKLTLERLDEGPVAYSIADYERLNELPLAKELGLYALPYTIVGQRQLLQLPALPRDYAEAMRALSEWRPKENILFDGPPQAGSFRSAEEHQAAIRNSTLHDAQGRLAFMARPYRGPTLTFPQNPNPHLFRGEGKPTVASYTLDYYVPMMLESKYVDGMYLDSLGRWCGYDNFRREHFKDSTVPLTYAGTPPRVSLWNLQSHAEYMWEARRRLHARGKILMANGVHPERVMLGFACDVLGREGAPALGLGEPFYALRVAAGAKPYCLLNAHHRASPQLWNACVYMGYLMGCNDPKGLADERKYLPVIIRCNEAGWEPVTHARAAPEAIGVERWGGQQTTSPLLFSVMNRSSEAVTATLRIDLAALRRSGKPDAHAVLGAQSLRTELTGRELVLHIPLGAEEANVIELRE